MKKDVERLEEALDVVGPPTDEDVLRCLAAVLSSAQLTAVLARDGFVGKLVSFVIPSPDLVKKLILLVRLDTPVLGDAIDDASDAQVGYGVEYALYWRIWARGTTNPLRAISARVRDKDFVRLLESYSDDKELIEAVRAVRLRYPPETTMKDLMAKLGKD